MKNRNRTRRRDEPWLDFFWSFVIIAGPDECWDWNGRLNDQGYGVITPETGPRHRVIRAHRVSYEIAYGSIPAGKVIRHRVCGRPPCVNPAHLTTGTQQENIQDTWDHGRVPKGEAHCFHKLTEEQVREARRVRAAGGNITQMAQELGVTQGTLWEAATGKTWKHIK